MAEIGEGSTPSDVGIRLDTLAVSAKPKLKANESKFSTPIVPSISVSAVHRIHHVEQFSKAFEVSV